MSEPIIYTKNYVTEDSAITVTSGDASKPYLYDRDNDSKWTTSGANSDATSVSVEVDFYQGSTATPRTIDTLFIVNHNFKNYAAYAWTSDGWNTLLTTQTGYASSFTKASFTPVETAKILLNCDVTQTTNAEKYAGELIACAVQLDLGKDPITLQPRYRQKVKELTLGDGSIHQMVTRYSANRISKYECNVKFEYVPVATLNSLRAIKESGEPFLWQPESVARPDQIFYVHWASQWSDEYSTSYKTAGFDITMSLKEI